MTTPSKANTQCATGKYTSTAHRPAKTIHAPNFIRSAAAPEISATVMAANSAWNNANRLTGSPLIVGLRLQQVLHPGEFGEAADESAVGSAEGHREPEQHPQHADERDRAERHHHHVGRALDRDHAAVEQREPGDHQREADDATQHECCGSCIHVHIHLLQ